MRKGFTALAVVGIAAVVAVFALTQNSHSTSLYGNALTAQDYEFIKFVSNQGKSYGTKEEFEFRSALFKQTLAKIEAENLKTENTFTVGINKFADWTKEEYRRLLGYKSMRAIAKNTTPQPLNVSIPP